MTGSDQTPPTILEEFLLLALDDEAGRFYPLPRSAMDYVSAGAVLMDLALRARIDNDLKDMFIVNTTPVGDEILDPVLQTIALAPILSPQPITHWLREFADEGEALRERALRRLEARGVLRREDTKILWVFGARRYPLLQDKEAREVKSRISGVILRDDIPAPHDMMLVALAHACGLFRHLLDARDLEAAASRIEAVSRMDLIGQAVGRAIMDVEGAIAMTSCFR